MEKLFEKLGDRLSNFFTRSVAPSSVFFILLFFNDMYFNNYEIFKYIQKLSDIIKLTDLNLLYLAIIIIFLGYGYINQLFTQILDNQIKTNYNFCDYNFLKLRGKVHNSIKKDNNLKSIFNVIDFTDYNAYQVLGKDIKVSASYVDEVKSIHTLAVAIIFNSAILSFYFHVITSFQFLVFSTFLIIFFHFIAKSRYKVRNKRLYINYLLKKDESKTKEKELKIKSLKVEIDE